MCSSLPACYCITTSGQIANHRARARAQRKELQKRIRKLGLEGTVFVDPAVPHHEMPRLLAQADVCVAPLAYNDRM